MSLVGFFAFPSGLPLISQAARHVCASKPIRGTSVSVDSWEELDIPGKFISNEIISKIAGSDFLVADISRLNFNVVYEIGYAIGKGKRILLVKHRAISSVPPTIQDVGIFDTLGYKEYSTAEELAGFVGALSDVNPLPIRDQRNSRSPIYVVQPKTKTDFDGFITRSIKKSRLYFRSFDPSESPRMAGPETIEQVGESYGVVLHLLPNEHVDAPIHNIRSAFVAGLTDGLDRQGLYIQSGETPIGIDLRDFVKVCRDQQGFTESVSELAELVYQAQEQPQPKRKKGSASILASLDLGASAAENELTSLGEYYIEIDAFRRAHRREVRLVTGRKGSGKTAIFFMLRDRVRSTRSNVVLDLKPEGFELRKLKDTVVRMMSEGTAEHTVTAFWEYLLWLEVGRKLIEKDQENHKRDNRLFEPYQRLKAAYIQNSHDGEGDFAERIKRLIRDIVQAMEAKYAEQTRLVLNTPQITELVHRHDFNALRAQIVQYLKFKSQVWLLFDNIDKGWASQGVSADDLTIVRALLDATRRIERELSRSGIEGHTIVFLRNDIFEHLIDSTSDRGKETRVNVDWDDHELLRTLVHRRMARYEEDPSGDFWYYWSRICVPMVEGENSAQYLIDRCLMRPRSLLELIGHCRGYAMNLGHEKITKEDILKGCSAYSNDLLAELGLEIRDVYPSAHDLLYAFIGAKRLLQRDEVLRILSHFGIPDSDQEEVIRLLMWFGFLGFVWSDGSHRYIYSFHYNMKVMSGSHTGLLNSGVTYTVNPAFVPALGIVD